jgi:hypothetical protein
MLNTTLRTRFVLILAVVAFVFALSLSIAGAQPPYGFQPEGSTGTAGLVTRSNEVDRSPGGITVYLNTLRGLPAGLNTRFIGAFDLLGNRTYTFTTTSRIGFRNVCANLVVYKVQIDGSVGRFVNVSCSNDVITIRNTDGTGTFLIFSAPANA